MPRIIIGKVVGPPGKDGTQIILNDALATEVAIDATLQDGKIVVPNMTTGKNALNFYTASITPFLKYYTLNRFYVNQNDALKLNIIYGGRMKITIMGIAYVNSNTAGINWVFDVGLNIHNRANVAKKFIEPVEDVEAKIIDVDCLVIDTVFDESATVLLKFNRSVMDVYGIVIELMSEKDITMERIIDTEVRTPVYSKYIDG